MSQNIKNFIILFTLFLFLFSIIFVKADDLNVDLGRHIISGQTIVQDLSIPYTNNFSYTYPTYPFANHYWLTDVLFYLLSASFGMNSLLLLKMLIISCSIGIIWFYSYKNYGLLAASFASFIGMPIFIVRNVVRPELFGYIFFSVIFILLLQYPKNKKYIFFIPLIMILWINLSITFIFGMLLVGLFIIKLLLMDSASYTLEKIKCNITVNKKLFWILIISLGLLLVNPQGIVGVFEPFHLMQTAVVHTSEMKSIFEAYPHPLYTYTIYILLFACGVLIYLLIQKKYLLSALLSVFIIMATLQNRNITFFIFIFIPCCASILYTISKVFKKRLSNEAISNYKMLLQVIVILLFFLSSLPFLTNSFYKTFDTKQEFGIGFYENLSPAVTYLQKNKLSHNLFNNFDPSGYLIYIAYPEYKPYIDNRPEAFPSEFVENDYLNVLINTEDMQRVFKKYDIQTVFLQLDSGDLGARKMVVELSKDKT